LIPKQKSIVKTELPAVAPRAITIQNSIEEHWYAVSVEDTPAFSIQESVEKKGLWHQENKRKIDQSTTTPYNSRARG